MGVSDSHQTDGELLFSLGRGDASAYRLLFQRHERSAYRVALAMMRSPWDAEEVVSASFLELWRTREKVRLVDGSVLPWLFTVISYQAKNHTRAGLDIAQELQGIGLIASAGTICPVLSRLEATGYVVSKWVVESDERPRRFYELTASGRAEVGAFRSEWTTFAQTVSTMLDEEGNGNG